MAGSRQTVLVPVPAATSAPQRAPAGGGAALVAVTAGRGRSRRGAAAAAASKRTALLQGQGRFARAGTVTAPTAPARRGDDGRDKWSDEATTPPGRLLAAFSHRPATGEGELARGQPVPTVRPRPGRPEAAEG